MLVPEMLARSLAQWPASESTELEDVHSVQYKQEFFPPRADGGFDTERTELPMRQTQRNASHRNIALRFSKRSLRERNAFRPALCCDESLKVETRTVDFISRKREFLE